MLNDAKGLKKVYIVCGRTDLRHGIDGLAMVIQNQFHLNPFDEGTLFVLWNEIRREYKERCVNNKKQVTM